MSLRAVPGLSLLIVLGCAAGESPIDSSMPPGITSVSQGDPTLTGGTSTTEPASDTTAPLDPTTGAPQTTVDPTTGTPVDPTTTTAATTTTTDPCGPCDAPPDPCLTAPGDCIDGACTYPPAPPDTPCDDLDACTADDRCDDAGTCQGTPLNCDLPNATGGACQDGACTGYTCTAPYEDCDSDPANGCEVPVGVANQCDLNGLTPDGGCWTAYCGASDDASAHNFGTYYCFDCANCNTPSPGNWQWCNHSTGNWYAPAAGSCGANEDQICGP